MTSSPTYRTQTDSFGSERIAADRYWGPQTQRAVANFPIGHQTMPRELLHALGQIKAVAAPINVQFGHLDPNMAEAIVKAAQEVADGKLDEHFPLPVWQSGSGTQTNMNANEVIANRANEHLGVVLGETGPVHPNDHVNMSQSSNDTIPTAIHIAATTKIHTELLPAMDHLEAALKNRSVHFRGIVKIGRTHLQDATPLTLEQEFSAFVQSVASARRHIQSSCDGLLSLAQGGTAVGTGLNSPAGFGAAFAAEIADRTGLSFRPTENPFEALATHDAALHAHGALNAAAASLHKIANDIRLLGSGPRAGLAELQLPANEPGSSIMPGKVNPTQAEAVTMVAARVFGNHSTITFAAANGHLQLNVYKPVIADALLQSIGLLADAARSFADRCVAGLEANEERIQSLLNQSLMLVTALAPTIGYDKAAQIAKMAHENNTTLREEALKSGHVDAATFDRIVRPEMMAAPDQLDEM